MHYLTFVEPMPTEYEVAILVPRLVRHEIERHYLPYVSDIADKVIAYSLDKTGKKTSVAHQKEYLEELLPTLMDLGVKYLIVCDGDYFKTITRQSTVDNHAGYVLDGVGDFKVIYCPNFQQIFYDPDKVKVKITQAFYALRTHMDGTYTDPGQGVIHKASYPTELEDIRGWLQHLLDNHKVLTCDIEGFALKHYDAGIATITFCWTKHEGIAFPVDYEPFGERSPEGFYGQQTVNQERRDLLRWFFEEAARRDIKFVYHNITYDVYVLVYQLFMEGLLDTAGLLYGLEVLLKNWEDTKLITYLATNTMAGNKLGLKHQSQEFTGDYAVEEIADVRKIPLDKLLEYNLIDGLATWFVLEKHWQTMIDDGQEEFYDDILRPAVPDIIQMQLTGLPLDMDEVLRAEKILEKDAQDAIDVMMQTSVVQSYIYELKLKYVDKRNHKLKKKRITLNDPEVDENVDFNPNSAPQLQELLYDEDFLDLPVLDYTDSKLPATGKDTLEKLINHTGDPAIKEFLQALIDYKAVAIILSTFIPAFKRAPMAEDGHYYLCGFFNLGGTVSCRLSSNGPNLQNLPATGSRYAKLIKKCFRAFDDWLFGGLDFNALEDRISALTTKDPMKLKVYTDGFDGHCLRALFYFGNRITHPIDPTDPKSVNSIKKLYPELRQLSKTPTFALTYQGTYITLMNNNGFSEELAKQIEKAYHELYKVSDDWVADQLKQAGKDGFVTVAFGLKLRTPLLRQTILGTRKTPFEAEAEGRSAGNALGQSWCLLNTRAASEFMAQVRMGKFRLDIKPCAQIHDASYYIIRNDAEVIAYVNELLVRAVGWQHHPAITHPDVKLEGELSIFWPTWADELVIPNGATEDEIVALAEAHMNPKEKTE